jgi:crossover junction endodeoxyribonuclease RusA
VTDELSRVEFTVLGLPQPQGSKTTVVRKGRRPVMREDSPLTEPWRATVAARAQAAMAGRQLRSGALRMRVVFVFPRPAAHFGTGRNHGRLKASAPLYCRTRPDVDKLLRAIGDALTGLVFRDDAQLVIVQAEKHYGEPPHAFVVVEELALEDDRPAPEPER